VVHRPSSASPRGPTPRHAPAALCAAFLLLLCLAAGTARADPPAGAPPEASYNLLANPSLEAYDPPYGLWQPWDACEVDEQVAAGWQRFGADGPEPAWLDARTFADSCMGSGWVECINGATCQFVAGLEPYDAGIYQAVEGLAPGTGYGFHAVLMTLWQSSAYPRTDGRIFKQVGIDPSGGSDPNAPGVLWSEPNGIDKAWDLQQRLSFTAQGSRATAFIRVTSLDPAFSWPLVNLSILDSALLAQAPSVAASSPPSSWSPSFWVAWDDVVLAPGAKHFRGCDVQWMDEAEGTWHDWLIQTMEPGAAFEGAYGHTYRFRARAWQQYENDAWLHGPYAEPSDSRTAVYWAQAAGRVTSPEGRPLWGALVEETEGGQARTGIDGRYLLSLPPGREEVTLAAGAAGWLAPPPAQDVDVAQGQTVSVDWVLRPPDDTAVNGQFEQELAGWQVSWDGGAPPEVVSEPVHTGLAALQLGSEAAPSHTAAVSQVALLSNAWEPALSMLYWPLEVDEGDLFALDLALAYQAGPGEVVTTTWTVYPSLDTEGWAHFWTAAGPAGTAVTGTLDIRLRVADDGGGPTVVLVDELSLGSTPGGPFRVFFPAVRGTW
jgi:hypothetical protein